MAGAGTANFPAASESRMLRLALIFLMYVAQGLPLGLFYIAIPTWLAVSGASAAEVGTFLSATSLPWTLKFFNGFLMERFTFLPMGRRRAWLIGSQLLIVAGLLAIALLAPGPRDILLLSSLSFLINVATTFQDVAVDGMAVDLVPDGERPVANGLMFGGQALGMAGAGAAAGLGLSRFGVGEVMLVAAGAVLLLLVTVMCCRERPGERLLPWSEGRPSAATLGVQLQAWRPILVATWIGMTERRSLFILSLLLCTGLMSGLYAAVAPLMGANAAGWSTERTSGLMAAGSLAAGLSAAVLVGPIAARFGPRTVATAGFAVQCALGIALIASQPHWAEGGPIRAFLLLSEPLTYLLAVCIGPLAMQQCRPAVSATQFGLFMAMNNFGRSLAAALLAPLESLGGFAGVLMAYAAAGATGFGLLWWARARAASAP